MGKYFNAINKILTIIHKQTRKASFACETCIIVQNYGCHEYFYITPYKYLCSRKLCKVSVFLISAYIA